MKRKKRELSLFFYVLLCMMVRHLLDLATSQFAAGQPLMAPVKQQQLADAVGSSREAIARVLAVNLLGDGVRDALDPRMSSNPDRMESSPGPTTAACARSLDLGLRVRVACYRICKSHQEVSRLVSD